MGTGKLIVSLRWHSQAASHDDRLYLAGVDLARARIGPLIVPDLTAIKPGTTVPARFEPPRRDASEIRNTSLYGWRHTPPKLGRYYPRGLLQEFPRTDLRPFRVVNIGQSNITADFNPALAGIAASAEIHLLDTPATERDGDADADAALTAWLANGPGMQAPLPDDATDFLSADAFVRGDESPDNQFYARERCVDHLDEPTRADLSAHYRQHLRPDMRVLDLMASWNSHLPDTLPLEVTGLGMNASELAHNPRLAQRLVHDLNRAPTLPFADGQFDAVLCALSIEYLTHPIAVLREVGRVLAPGAPCIVSFSDRWFPPKAIRLWSELHPFERLAFVVELFQRSGLFAHIHTDSLQGRPAPAGNWRPQRRPNADPLFIVTGYRIA